MTSSPPETTPSAPPAPEQSRREAFPFRQPNKADAWIIRGGLLVAFVGAMVMGYLIIHRLKTRPVLHRLPKIEELAVDAENPTTISPAGRGEDSKPSANATADAAYRAGIQQLVAGRYDSASRALDHALLLDSTLAGAALRRSLLAAWEGESKIALDQALNAKRLAASLSPHEKAMLDAHLIWMGGDIPRADSAWRVSIMAERGDPMAWYGAAFVQLHDGGAIDTALTALGSPTQRHMRRIPDRRVSFVNASPPLRRVLALVPTHERARLQLAKMAAAIGNIQIVDGEAWNVERADVESVVRLTMRALAADMRWDSSLWAVVKATAAKEKPRDLFVAARILAEGGGMRSRMALFHAADLLEPLTKAPNDSATIARAHVWRALMRDASGRAGSALDELALAAQYDPSVALPTAAYVAWLDPSTVDTTLRRVRDELIAWQPKVLPPQARDEFHPHAGMERHVRAYAIGLVSAALRDSVAAYAAAKTIDSLGPIANETHVAESMAIALRTEVRMGAGDIQGAVALSSGLQAALRPLARNESPIVAQLHSRYRFGFLEARGWRNDNARGTFVAFFTPTIPELTLYRPVVEKFETTP